MIGIEVPLDLKFLTALHGGIGGIRHHRNAAELLEQMGLFEGRKLNRLLDALDLQGFGVVERFDFGIVYRGAFDGGVEHTGPLGIHPEDRLAGHNIVLVDRGDVLADVAVVFRFLKAEVGFCGNGKCGGDGDQFAQIGAAVGGGVRDLAHSQGHFARRHSPFLCGGAFQHEPGGGTGLAHGLNEVTDGAGAIGVLGTEPGIADGLFDADCLPIDIELFGNDERQRGTASGAHFGAVRGDYDLAVGFKAEIDAGLPGGGGRRLIGEEIRAQHHGAGGENGAEEGAAIHGKQFDGYAAPRCFSYASRVRRAISETVLGAASMAAAPAGVDRARRFPERGSWCRRDSSWLISPPRRS